MLHDGHLHLMSQSHFSFEHVLTKMLFSWIWLKSVHSVLICCLFAFFTTFKCCKNVQKKKQARLFLGHHTRKTNNNCCLLLYYKKKLTQNEKHMRCKVIQSPSIIYMFSKVLLTHTLCDNPHLLDFLKLMRWLNRFVLMCWNNILAAKQ